MSDLPQEDDIEPEDAQALDRAAGQDDWPDADDQAGGDDIAGPGADDADDHPPTAIEAAEQAEMTATVEAILFASDTPLTPARVAQVAQLTVGAVRKAVRTLNDRYEQAGSAFRVEMIAGGCQMLTLAQYHDVLGRLFKARGDSKLSQAAMETLAIIAYRQPVLRADLEAIRGVASGEVIRTLLERGLVKIVGRAEVLGRPMLYGTTKRFLEVFGLASLEDLPNVKELRPGNRPAPKAPAEPASSAPADSAPPAPAASLESAAPPAPAE